MFVGHVAAGLVAKRVAPQVSLGTAVTAAVLVDLLCFVLLMSGVEHFGIAQDVVRNRFMGYGLTYSHTLLMDVIWGALFAGVWMWRYRDRFAAVVLFVAVVSHWFLDMVSHRPDMRLAPWTSTAYGLGLWNSLPAALFVEGGFWLVSIVLYLRLTRAGRRAGISVFWTGAVLFTLMWLVNMNSGIEANEVKAGFGGLIVFLLVVGWAYWCENLRVGPPILDQPR